MNPNDKQPFVDGLPYLPTRTDDAEQQAFNASVVSYQHPDRDTGVWPPEGLRHV